MLEMLGVPNVLYILLVQQLYTTNLLMAYISAFHPSSKPHKENNNQNTSYHYVLLYI